MARETMFATIESIRSRENATDAEKSLSSQRLSQGTHETKRRWRNGTKKRDETKAVSLTSFNPIGTPRAEGKRRRSDL